MAQKEQETLYIAYIYKNIYGLGFEKEFVAGEAVRSLNSKVKLSLYRDG